MDFSLSKLKTARITPEGLPVVRDPKRGAKWACLATVGVIAVVALAALIASLVFVTISIGTATPLAIAATVMQVGAGAVLVFPLMYSISFLHECIQNTKHHLNKKPPVFHQYQQLQPPPRQV